METRGVDAQDTVFHSKPTCIATDPRGKLMVHRRERRPRQATYQPRIIKQDNRGKSMWIDRSSKPCFQIVVAFSTTIDPVRKGAIPRCSTHRMVSWCNGLQDKHDSVELIRGLWFWRFLLTLFPGCRSLEGFFLGKNTGGGTVRICFHFWVEFHFHVTSATSIIHFLPRLDNTQCNIRTEAKVLRDANQARNIARVHTKMKKMPQVRLVSQRSNRRCVKLADSWQR